LIADLDRRPGVLAVALPRNISAPEKIL